jgi:hypothetical protein
MVVTIRVNNQSIKVYYNEKFVAAHGRSYLKNKVFTIEGHRAGLLERKPGSQRRETWQLGFIKGLGPKMAEYVELIRQGPRSLKNELSKLVALVTVYGEALVIEACGECLASGIVGTDAVELYLKKRQRPQDKTNPNPIKFTNERLNRVVPVVDLRRYDALLFEGFKNKSASEVKLSGEQSVNRIAGRAETQILEPGPERRSAADDGARTPSNYEVLGKMGEQGESRTKNPDDRVKSEICEIPSTSDGGDLRF